MEEFNTDKTRHLLALLASRVDVGKTKLMKLLYLIDFISYERTGRSITNDSYKHWVLGPVPQHVWSGINDDLLTGILKQTKRGTYIKFTPEIEPDLEQFDKRELEVIEEVIRQHGHKSQDELVKMVHEELPYLITDENEEIPYFLATYRNYKRLTKEQVESLKNNKTFTAELQRAYEEYLEYYALQAA